MTKILWYKNHKKTFSKSKLIINNYQVTDASVHDTQTVEDLIDESHKRQDFYADSACVGKN